MKEKILYIASADLEVKSGGSFANLAFYRSLLTHYKDKVDLIPFTKEKPDDIKSDYFVPPKGIGRKLLDFPKGIIHRFKPWMSNFLQKHGQEYSCCIINDGLKGDIIPLIKKYIPKIIVIHHNCEVDFQNDNNRPTTLFGLFPYWVRKNEEMSFKSADLNIFLTQYDKEKFLNSYGKIDDSRMSVVGMFLPETENLSTYSPLNTNKFAICGGLNNIQTKKGIRNFERYLPTLRRTIGDDLHLTIAGRNPGNYIKSLAKKYDYVTVIENPTNMQDVLIKSGIFICPINVGSGIKLRIMDGLKLGMPILTHEVSSRGYEAFFNEPWFRIYHDIESFERGVKGIISYCKEANNIRQIIIEKFLSVFSFENGDSRFFTTISKICF